MATSARGNVGCGTTLLFFFILGFVTTLGVRAAMHILGM